ncbi:MAG: hypothetical protein AABY13_05715 [Nanoarchaeota archaeon]
MTSHPVRGENIVFSYFGQNIVAPWPFNVLSKGLDARLRKDGFELFFKEAVLDGVPGEKSSGEDCTCFIRRVYIHVDQTQVVHEQFLSIPVRPPTGDDRDICYGAFTPEEVTWNEHRWMISPRVFIDRFRTTADFCESVEVNNGLKSEGFYFEFGRRSDYSEVQGTYSEPMRDALVHVFGPYHALQLFFPRKYEWNANLSKLDCSIPHNATETAELVGDLAQIIARHAIVPRMPRE